MKILIALMLSLVLYVCIARADDGVFEGSGGTVALSKTEYVHMIAEEVILDLTERDIIHVSCLFVVVNEGPADTLLLGFPDYWPSLDEASNGAFGPSAIHDLVVMVDGISVATKAVPVSEASTMIGAEAGRRASYNQAHVWTCTFSPGQTRVLRTEYSHVFSTSSSARQVVRYVLKTGASWAGPIGQVVVRVKPGDLRVKNTGYPSEWEFTGTEYVWSVSDLEPTRDIAIGMENPNESARSLAQSWRWYTGRDSSDNHEDSRRELLDSIMLRSSSPEFLAEVCSALGDTIPELRQVIEDAIHSQRDLE